MFNERTPPSAPQNRRWPIWVISLTSAKDRREDIAARFSAAKLEFEFLDAIDGRMGLSPEHERMIDRPRTLERDGTPLSNGEYACALSHQAAYLRVIKENLPGAIVFEDDVLLTSGFRNFYEQRDYEAAPMIQLFYFEARIWRGRGRTLASGVRLHRLAEPAFMTAAYSVSRVAAEQMRNQSLPIRGPADWPCDVTKIGMHVTLPRLAIHPDPESQVSLLSKDRANKDLSNYDPNRPFAKGWRRLITPASWRRFAMKRASRMINPGFALGPGEHI